jgi:hypothetical protein
VSQLWHSFLRVYSPAHIYGKARFSSKWTTSGLLVMYGCQAERSLPRRRLEPLLIGPTCMTSGLATTVTSFFVSSRSDTRGRRAADLLLSQ